MKKYLLFFTLIAFNAAAQKPQLIEKYGNWSAYYYNDGSQNACFISTQPILETGKYTSRQNVLMTITHRPNQKAYDLVTIKGGYNYKKGAPVSIKIGSTTVDKLFTTKDKAWAYNSKTDKEIIDLFSKGQKAIVTAFNEDGVETKDTYSLSGFNEAYKTINLKCKKK